MTNGLIKFLLLLTVFLTPLLVANFQFGYEQIKVLVFLALITLSGFIWLLTKPKLSFSSIEIFAAIFIYNLAITSAIGLNPIVSFLGLDPYFQDWILYAYLFLFFLMVSNLQIKFRYWAIMLAVSSFIVSVLALKDWVFLNILHTQVPNYAGRVVSSFGQPNFYAGFVLLSLPFTYYLLVKTKTKLNLYMIYFVLLVEIFAIVVSESRTAFLLLVFLSFILLMGKAKAWFFITFITVIIIHVFRSCHSERSEESLANARLKQV